MSTLTTLKIIETLIKKGKHNDLYLAGIYDENRRRHLYSDALVSRSIYSFLEIPDWKRRRNDGC